MVYFSLHQISHNLKAHVNSWKSHGLVFSYDLKATATQTDMTISLRQKETNFSIFMDIEEQKHFLRITRFTLVENSQLENLSEGLYDAALIEIVLQALDIIFFCAEHQDQEETVFVLPDEEASHLTPFKSYFDEVSSHLTTSGNRIFMTLLTSGPSYELFVNQSNNIKTKVRQALWSLQRTDPVLRHYLQNPGQPITGGFTGFKEQDVPDLKTNVINFPKLAFQG